MIKTTRHDKNAWIQVQRERHLFIAGEWKICSGRNMASNEADSKTYVMQTNHNHAQEFAKAAHDR